MTPSAYALEAMTPPLEPPGVKSVVQTISAAFTVEREVAPALVAYTDHGAAGHLEKVGARADVEVRPIRGGDLKTGHPSVNCCDHTSSPVS